MANRKTEVDLSEALRGAFIVFENGRNLLEEAEILQRAGRFPRAIALSVLAIEEFGKLVRLLQIDRYQEAGHLKEFWDWFRDHRVKAGLDTLVATGSREDEQGLDHDWHFEEGKMLHDFKMSTLYVDFVDGSFRGPQDFEDLPRLAAEMIARARSSYESRLRVMTNIDSETYWDNKVEIRAQLKAMLEDPKEMDRYLQGREDDPAAKRLRNLARRMTQRDEP